MNEVPNSEISHPHRTRSVWGKGLTGLALVAAVGGGYALRGSSSVTAQPGGTPGAVPPVVQTQASRDASNIQKAFQDVAREAEPAVVTITTESPAQPVSGSREFPRRNPFGSTPGAPDGGGDDDTPGNDANPFGGNGDLNEFMRRFQRDFGFQPNSAQREQMGRQYLHNLQAERRGGGLGSGMIFRSDGLILTNAHVVRGSQTVDVKLNDGRDFRRARVLGIDERSDVAVVKINATDLPVVKFGDSSEVSVGDWAIAVGNPFGLAHTVTVGVISAKAREVDIDPRSPGDYLQTDASINPGNSGGPLMDINGRVIGINNAIYSQSGGNVGIGFAIPIDTARDIADRLLRDGRIVRGYLGVRISSLDTAEAAISMDLDASVRGVKVEDVDANTPGSRAGLQAGDIITKFNDQPVSRSAELQRIVGNTPVNSQVRLTVLRAGQTITLNATLSQLPDEAGAANGGNGNGGNGGGANGGKGGHNGGATAPEEAPAPSTLGMRLRSITPQLTQRYNIPAGAHGAVVVAVDPNSAASAAEIKVGDIVERVGQTVISSPAEVQANVTRILNRQAEGDKSVSLYVNTQGTRRYVILNAEQ